jgi:hypothetical protein
VRMRDQEKDRDGPDSPYLVSLSPILTCRLAFSYTQPHTYIQGNVRLMQDGRLWFSTKYSELQVVNCAWWWLQ